MARNIDDLVQFVQLELGNRADLVQGNPSRIQNWIWRSYLNLVSSYHFHEADDTDASQVWQAGGPDFIVYPPNAQALNSVIFYRQTDGTPIKVNWKDIAFLRRYPGPQGTQSAQQNVGPPAVIAPYGQSIFIRPLCDSSTYAVVIDFRRRVRPATNLGDTELWVPDSFLEVIEFGAEMRGHASLGEPEKAN